MEYVLRPAVETGLAHIADVGEQPFKEGQFAFALVRDLRVQAECCSMRGASCAKAAVPAHAEGVVVTDNM